MTAHPRTADFPAPHPIALPSGLPLAAVVARAKRAFRRSERPAPALTPTPVPEPAPVTTPLPFVVLLAALRGYTLTELAAEMTRIAQEAALHRTEVEGLQCGRTYGDRTLTGLEPAAWLTPALAEATRRADMAGALADLVRGLVGREASLAEAFLPAGHPARGEVSSEAATRPLRPGALGLWTPTMAEQGSSHPTDARAPRKPAE